MTGYSRTKVNRCLAEGRERFRAFLTRSESGGRCAELRPVLSAFCDGEARPEETSALREHLRVCAHCRAAMRAYRAAPGAAAALAPVPIAVPSLLDRAHEALAGLQARLPGGGRALSESTASQVAAAGGAQRGRRRGPREGAGRLRRNGGRRGRLRQRRPGPSPGAPRRRPHRHPEGRADRRVACGRRARAGPRPDARPVPGPRRLPGRRPSRRRRCRAGAGRSAPTQVATGAEVAPPPAPAPAPEVHRRRARAGGRPPPQPAGRVRRRGVRAVRARAHGGAAIAATCAAVARRCRPVPPALLLRPADLRVADGDGWRARNGFELRWDKPAAPHDRLCPLPGQEPLRRDGRRAG